MQGGEGAAGRQCPTQPVVTAPLSPIVLPRRSSVARDALLSTPCTRCPTPAAVIPQSPSCRHVRALLADSAPRTPSTLLSPILSPYKLSESIDTLLATPFARCAAPVAVIRQHLGFMLNVTKVAAVWPLIQDIQGGEGAADRECLA